MQSSVQPIVWDVKLPARPSGAEYRAILYRAILRMAVSTYLIVLRLATWLGRQPRAAAPGEGQEILLTGQFHADNWATAHLRPLAAAENCAHVTVVATYPVPPLPKVTLVRPPRWLQWVLGSAGARLATLTWLALRDRPHIVGGFHLLLNGLAAAVVARLCGARALYFCVGGPAEVLGGGIQSENRLFGRLKAGDPVIEGRLIRAVAAFDLVVTMGSRAVRFFQSRGIRTRFHVVSGGIDVAEFRPGPDDAEPTNDLILVGRLAEIKRIDVFLRALQRVAQRIPTVSALIVGEGEKRLELGRLAQQLGLADYVTFAGHRRDVAALLRRSRIFVLTSDSEGLALSLMEAMSCGLPAVVSDVGDLADLVAPGVNGYLVPPGAPDQFADAIVALLSRRETWARFSQAAYAAARRHESAAVARQWDEILSAKNME